MSEIRPEVDAVVIFRGAETGEAVLRILSGGKELDFRIQKKRLFYLIEHCAQILRQYE